MFFVYSYKKQMIFMHTFSPLYALFCVNICEKPLTFTKTILFNCIFPVYFCIVGRKDLAYEFYTVKIKNTGKVCRAIYNGAANVVYWEKLWVKMSRRGKRCLNCEA